MSTATAPMEIGTVTLTVAPRNAAVSAPRRP
ncbi:MAG: hypothetical protein RLZZ253_3279 [Verrucomicrobiota bacterium]